MIGVLFAFTLLNGAVRQASAETPQPPVASRELNAVEMEFLVRDRAAHVAESLDSIEADLNSEHWRVRRAAVEVLARTRDGAADRTRELVLLALRDPHPNVRARAVDAAGQRRIDAGGELWTALANDALPDTRLALVRTLALVRPLNVSVQLAVLAGDEDSRVADEAFLALLALGDAGRFDAAVEWKRRDMATHPAALIAATEALSRGPCAAQLFAVLESDASQGEAALLASAQARCSGTADPRALLAGWFAPHAKSEVVTILRRRAQLLDGAEALGAAILPHLTRDLQALDRWLAGDPDDLTSRRPELAKRLRAEELSAEGCRGEWTEAAVGAARGRGSALNELFNSLSDDGFRALAESAYGRLDALDPPGNVRARRYSGERYAMTELAGEIYVRTFDTGAAAWLVQALTDAYEPCRREAAFALSSVADLRPYQRELHKAWMGLSYEPAMEWLARFSRRYPLDSFRSDWISLWENESGEVSVIELLGAFQGDRELVDRASEWLRRELQWLEQAQADGTSRQRGSEGRAKACLMALVRLGADETVFLEALERAESVSEEVAKAAAAELAKTARGREALLPWLASSRPQRLRLEAAIAIAPTGNAAALEVLVTAFAGCDEELQVRSLRALGASGTEAAWTVPTRVAADRFAGAGSRLVAFEVLGAGKPTDRAARVLIELAGPDRDLEGRRLALRALGNTGAPEALAGLAALAEMEFAHETLREECLVAAAHCFDGAPQAWWLDAWRVRPAERAIEELRARFRGDRTAAIEFSYRAELECARAAAPYAEDMLEASGPWWRGDARWLRELAGVWWDCDVDVAEQAAHRLARAARIALAGEGPSDDFGLLRTQTGLTVVAAARAEGRFVEAAREIEELLIDWRLGHVWPRDWERALGSLDRSAGRDPRSRVQVLLHDSRARAALAARNLAEARAEFALAQLERGDSSAAQSICDQLADAIESADR